MRLRAFRHLQGLREKSVYSKVVVCSFRSQIYFVTFGVVSYLSGQLYNGGFHGQGRKHEFLSTLKATAEPSQVIFAHQKWCLINPPVVISTLRQTAGWHQELWAKYWNFRENM